MLKSEVSQIDLFEIIDFFNEICKEDVTLATYYLSKYPSLLAKLHKRGKKVEKVEFNKKMLTLLIMSYQVLQFKQHTNKEWILSAICSIIGSSIQNKELRKSFYESLKSYGKLKLEGWIRNVG